MVSRQTVGLSSSQGHSDMDHALERVAEQSPDSPVQPDGYGNIDNIIATYNLPNESLSSLQTALYNQMGTVILTIS